MYSEDFQKKVSSSRRGHCLALVLALASAVSFKALGASSLGM